MTLTKEMIEAGRCYMPSDWNEDEVITAIYLAMREKDPEFARLIAADRDLSERAFRAEHRELVSAACWHRAATAARDGDWRSLNLRLDEMTADERHAAVIASMDAQREVRAARAFVEKHGEKNDG